MSQQLPYDLRRRNIYCVSIPDDAFDRMLESRQGCSIVYKMEELSSIRHYVALGAGIHVVLIRRSDFPLNIPGVELESCDFEDVQAKMPAVA